MLRNMSAIVLGKRSNIFEDLPSSSPPNSKRIRCSSSSPVRFSPPRTSPNIPSARSPLIDHLSALFPDMDKQLLEKALEECGDDLDSTIRSLNELRLGSADRSVNSAGGVSNGGVDPHVQVQSEENAAPEDKMDGAEWVELFVKEMMSASNVDDAKARASRALQVLEKAICARVSAETAQSFQQENMMLKKEMEALIQDNAVLKRAVTIQHERQKEYDQMNTELQQLKQLVSQYQEQVRTLEVNNYALTMHLKQAQQSNSIPGRYHPDVF